MKSILTTILKGLWIGGTLTVPGVSGGSMAMILGVYDKLIQSVGAFMHRGKDKKKAFFFLLEIGLAGILGFVLFSRLVSMLMARFPLAICFFFAGAVAGGIPIILRSAEIKRPKIWDLLFVLLGIACIFGISMIPEGLFSIPLTLNVKGIFLQLLCGILVAVGFVLPGVSLSQMLYVLGIYEDLMNHVSELNVLPLIPLAVGGVLGILLTAYAVESLLRRFPRATYLVIFGFMLGSLPEIFAGKDFSGLAWFQYLLFALLAIVGFAAIFAMSLSELRKDK
jgi:putative membrane protein